MRPDQQPDDRVLRAALLNVDLPSGLQQRLLDRLRAEAAECGQVPAAECGQVPATHNADRNDTPVVLAARDLPHNGKRSRRTLWATALALSIVALAALGIYQWTRPASSMQLAQFTLKQLDRLLSDEASWQTDFDPQLPELAVLQGQLRSTIRPIGFQDQGGGPVAEHCRVWKLYSMATHKVFFVFDFKQAKSVPSLTRQLQELSRSSGGWSVVAMQADGRVVVVAVEGRVDSYLYQLQSA